MAKCTGKRCPMQYGYKVDECNHTDCPYRTEPVTNADKIRAMSDEELAEFLCGVYDDDNCGAYQDECGKFINGTIILNYDQYKVAKWLRQPAE